MTSETSGKRRMDTDPAAPLTSSELRKRSRIAAFWYLLLTLTGLISLIYLPSKFNVPGDAAATLANIMASPGLYRLGIVIELFSLVVFLFSALSLYALFKGVNKAWAGILVALVIACVPIGFVTSIFKAMALHLGGGAAYLKAFTADQLRSLSMILLDMEQQGGLASEVFWGLWLFPMAILVIRSGFFPKILGVLQVIAGVGYLASFLAGMLFPGGVGIAQTIISVMLMGELPFIFWLIFVGARVKSPRQDAPAGA